MAPGSSDNADRSYLSTAVDSINPWNNSRTTAPAHGQRPDGHSSIPRPAESATPGDHSTNPFYGQSFRSYPPDCPALSVRWFHAVDIPKRKPQLVKGRHATQPDTKPPASPRKFSAFSVSDSRRIESRYQRLLETAEDDRGQASGVLQQATASTDVPSTTMPAGHDNIIGKPDARVPVNEDFLFDVNIVERELSPVYWLGPTYEVRRGTWFFQEGSTLRPCEENLAAQLEEGYLKLKPWLNPVRVQSGSKNVTSDVMEENLSATAAVPYAKPKSPHTPSTVAPRSQSPSQPPSYRLFGTYMNNIATYQDAATAWLSSDSMLSWVTTSVYERFAGGGYMSGLKLIRGYSEPNKSKEIDEKDTTPSPDDSLVDERQRKLLKRRSAPPMAKPAGDEPSLLDQTQSAVSATREVLLQRQISSLIASEEDDPIKMEEDIRRRDEQEIQDDYNAQAGETQGREIEHLVLVTHGIGQRLGLRMESVNFVHDVNVLRKTIKSVYTNSVDLKALNSEFGAGPGNCRVQVLPVCWRHLLEFPRQRQKGVEHDLGDVSGEEDDYPSLEDITIEGVSFARSLISDLALDVLLYQSSYREEISRIVLEESNRIFKLFNERNPEFKGKIHFMGHSLGSAILFDALCRQKQHRMPEEPKTLPRFWPSHGHQELETTEQALALDFDVGDFYCLGSPIGLFQMLKGSTIAARHALPPEMPLNTDSADDTLFPTPADPSVETVSSVVDLAHSVSLPKVEQIFNIFHPSDPISYRLEPLISPAMAALKPQLLPYTKKGIFGSVAPQGLTGIGAKVGQSVSGLWSSLSAGIASNLLRSSLKLSSDEMTQMTQQQQSGGGINHPTGEIPSTSERNEMSDRRQQHSAEPAAAAAEGHVGISGGNAPLADGEFETLYSKFQKNHMGFPNDGQVERAHEESRKARKLRTEESKVRALNRNGRVDYSIQESALDFNPINTIASHMGYWADEDVSHFVLSQLLSNQTKVQ